MGQILQDLAQWFKRLMRREPSLRLSANLQSDWLPPVHGPGDWSSGLMASMADRSAAWYFDRSD